MRRKFTDRELYVLRNEIPIQILIETKLKIPNKIRDGCFRFLSPCCGEFNTGIKQETNLARCFRCDKNFNTIDMVIAVRNLDFVNSVRFLRQFHEDLSRTTGDRESTSVCFDMGNPPACREKCAKPLPMKEILEDMTAKATFDDGAESDEPLFSPKGQVVARLSKLENEMMRLARQIEQIHTFIKSEAKK